MFTRPLLLPSALAILLPSLILAAPPQMAAWYDFEAPADPGHSVGMTVWPAVATGYDSAAGVLSLPGIGGNGLYLPNPVSFFGRQATTGTIAMRVKAGFDPAEDRATRVLIDFMRQAGNTQVDGYEIAIYLHEGKLKAKPWLTGVMEIHNPLSQGEWTHLCMTWDSTQGATLYLNGQKVGERNGAFTPTELEPGWPGRVGCHTPGGGFPFAGQIDDLQLFNTRLTADEVAQIAAVTRSPVLSATIAHPRALDIQNRGDAPATVTVQRWEPGRNARMPLYGPMPIGFDTEGFIAGAVPSGVIAEGIRLFPGEQRRVRLPREDGYLQARALRVLAGTGPLMREARANLPQRCGLRVEPAHPHPVIYLSGRPLVIDLRAANGLGRSFSGDLRAEVEHADGTPMGSAQTRLELADGADLTLALPTETCLESGSYRVTITATEEGRVTVLNRFRLHASDGKDCRSLCDIAAAYTSALDDESWLIPMERDGVNVLRMAGAGNAYQFDKIMSATLAHGFKGWNSPAMSYHSVCADPAKLARMKHNARVFGEYMRHNPAVVAQTIAGEGLSYPPCYCAACNEAFRDHLRARFGSLAALNAAWGSGYSDWDQVEQLGSPADVDEAAERLKIMKVAMELPSDNTARWRRLFELDRPRALCWKRWHDAVLVDWYAGFAKSFHETNEHQVDVCEQPCWPNFETHVLFSLGEIADLGGMDLYLPGEMPTTLGYAAELFLNFDMNASIFASRGKPLMVHELYVQDNSPELLPEAQGWWLLGRGYPLMTYFTYNYYYEGIRANLPLVFGLFDKDRKPYPTYPSFKRFSADIKTFDQQYDYHSLQPRETPVALFMGDDVSLANNLETGGATWEAAGVLGHNGAYWLTERNGLPVDFVNDEGLDRLAGKRVLVVPWCHVIRDSSLEKIARFARSGGTVIVDGPLGLFDENYRPYTQLPGGGEKRWGLAFDGFEPAGNTIPYASGEPAPARGVVTNVRTGRGEILHRDENGNPAVVRVPLGRGQVYWFLSAIGPTHRSRVPGISGLNLWLEALRGAGLQPQWTFASAPNQAAGDESSAGSLFDVSMRTRNGNELFVFAVSFFAASQGTLEIGAPRGSYKAFDAMTGTEIALESAEGALRLPIDLPSFGSQVIRIVASTGRPFASGRW